MRLLRRGPGPGRLGRLGPLGLGLRVVVGGLVGLGCRSSPLGGSAGPSGDAGAVRTTAAEVEGAAQGGADAGFVSAATELGAALVDAGGTRSLAAELVAGRAVAIPGGIFESGSAPGEEGRVHAAEPALFPVELRPFAIDALPFPNDPHATPALVGSPDEAARACGARGARLCSELEWERACKGAGGEAFASGASWNPDCDRAPSRCATAEGVRAMGFMPEWTESRFAGDRAAPVVRGGPEARHRCAARVRPRDREQERGRKGGRRVVDEEADEPARVAFRCCHGERNEALIAPIEAKASGFRRTSLEALPLATIFGEIPELVRIREGVHLFTEADGKAVVARGGASSDGITFSTTPILWSPEAGVDLLVATGRAKKTGFIVALWVLPPAHGQDKPRHRFASAFLLLNDASPVTLAYEPARRRELRWTSCWGCAGEQGAVSLRDDGRVVIVQY